MEVTKQRILDFYKDSGNLFFLWDKNDSFPNLINIRLLEHVAIIFTLKGEINFTSVVKKRIGDVGHIVIGNNLLCDTILNCSEDYHCEGLIISKKFWDQTVIHCHPCTPLAMLNPILEVTEEQKEILIDFLHTLILLRKEGKKDDHPIIRHLVNDLVIEISKIYEIQSKNNSVKSCHTIMREFTNLVYDNYKSHRDVDFYAEQLHITKRHLSSIIKNQGGMSAFKYIQMQVMIQASSMLRHTEKSIKEISIELNFDDTSHFCKYFRKNTGMSPEEYRKCDI